LKKNIDGSPRLFSSVPQSTQVSAVYNGIEELTELLAIYFKQGIEKGDYCLWISPEKDAERAKNEITKLGSQIELLPVGQLPENLDLLESAIKELVEKGYEKALSGGFSGIRTNIDLINLGNSPKHYLDTCKRAVETINLENNKKIMLLCTFPLGKLTGSTLLELMEENSIFIRRKGKWDYFGQLDEQLELENNLLKAKRDAEAANRTKNGFIINICHELRTPLNSVIGFSDLLLEGAFGPLNIRQSKHVNNILLSGKSLMEITNNLLDISKLEAGEKTLNYEEIDIASLLREVRISLLSFASNRKITVELNVDNTIENIRADKTKLKQILYNLINNAIKFTPEKGKVTVSASIRKGLLEIKVLDTGTGLLKEYYEKTLKPFTQADPSEVLKSGGAELGLYIVKNFIDLHGGEIYVDSIVGKGSIFTFTLPTN
jgi:signal transduction histidine kinase